MTNKPAVLIVDDEDFVRNSLTEVLTDEGFACTAAASVAQARKLLESDQPEVVVTDLKMPGGDGTLLLDDVRKLKTGIPVIVMTGVGAIADAVAAMKAGAHDFLQKPVDPAHLIAVVRRALEQNRLQSDVRFLREAVEKLASVGQIVSESPAMQRVTKLVAQVAPTDTTVLITGESGTGKGLVAEQIHRSSRRADRNLVKVNCASIPAALFESELFGHQRGAFSGATSDREGRFAEAEGGTLVLDDVSTLKEDMQAKLLRVLETREYQVAGSSRMKIADVRVIAISNEDLAARVARGQFRADLLYRLNVFPIEVPPLRQRREDVGPLVEILLSRMNRKNGSDSGISAEAVSVLQSYDWPGNVRELRNVLERALIVSGGAKIDVPVLRSILESTLGAELPASGPQELRLRPALDALERDLILKALGRTEGKKKEASLLLGVDPRNLGYYLRKHALVDGGDQRQDPR